MSEPTPIKQGRGAQPIEGRAELDAAWARFRRGMVRLAREGRRSDPETLAKLGPIVAEATQVLDRLAGEANAAVGSSARNRRLVAEAEQKAARVLRRLARQGDPRAVRMLRSMSGGRPDDAA
ncbi:hypothetical protein [Streptomyces sp. NPDC058653]|uniref:hypothetical protein n=1 Tax=Streptomyces sp. NPDC058653 TaxID=3346576 RepID=UPI0036501B88